jgi:hypothetical protein
MIDFIKREDVHHAMETLCAAFAFIGLAGSGP